MIKQISLLCFLISFNTLAEQPWKVNLNTNSYKFFDNNIDIASSGVRYEINEATFLGQFEFAYQVDLIHYEGLDDFSLLRGKYPGRIRTEKRTMKILRDDASVLEVIEHNLDRLHLSWESSSWKLRLGRQAFGVGVARFFRPMHLLPNPNSIAIQSEWALGVDAIRFNKYLNSSLSIDSGYIASDEKDRQIGFLGGLINLLEFDFGVYYMNTAQTNYHALTAQGNMGNSGLWFEGISSEENDYAASLGLDHYIEKWNLWTELFFVDNEKKSLILQNNFLVSQSSGTSLSLGLGYAFDLDQSLDITYLLNEDENFHFVSLGYQNALSDYSDLKCSFGRVIRTDNGVDLSLINLSYGHFF